jgi:hypothetical protein
LPEEQLKETRRSVRDDFRIRSQSGTGGTAAGGIAAILTL